MPNSLPTVYIGIPTGFTKAYASLYMLASIRNVDYPPEKIKLAFSVTDLGDTRSFLFKDRLIGLLEKADMPFTWTVLSTFPTMEDMHRWGPYFGVILNLHKLRVNFLEEEWDRFWLLGGDNPPHRDALKKLVECDVDVASALIHQRPSKKGDDKTPYTCLWQHHWRLEDLEEHDLEPLLRDELRRAWLEFAFLKYPPPLEEGGRVYGSVFGSGCSLVKREVLEHIGYALGRAGTHSEDLHFGMWALLLGFETCMDLSARCGHFDEDGQIY